MSCHVDIDRGYSAKLIQFLLGYNDIALDHQIQAAATGQLQSMPEPWLAWATKHDDRWKEIMEVYTSDQPQATNNSDMPTDLCHFINESRSISLPRKPFFVPGSDPPAQMHAVSPKKLHEVHAMSNYVASLFGGHVVKPAVVDIGAGQGYLSRALSSSPNNFHVLALDSDKNQTVGSTARKDWNSIEEPEKTTPEGAPPSSARGSLTQKTTFIGDASSLTAAIEDWIRNELSHEHAEDVEFPLPIVLVGLHCCGDLTPSILRFIEHSVRTSIRLFDITGCVVVGCCYNMCGSASFPLSQAISADMSRLGPFSLETQHLHLATQSPLTWNLEKPSADPFSPSAALSIRKVTYRALLARRLPTVCQPREGTHLCVNVDWRQKRVGRLGNAAYLDFPTYLRAAGKKLGLEARPPPAGEANRGRLVTEPRAALRDTSTSSQETDIGESDLSSEEKELSRKLEVLYVLRCLMGPVVESLIVVDRYLFLQEATKPRAFSDANPKTAELSEAEVSNTWSGEEGGTHLVNIFDQSTGSLRNLALVWVR